MGEPATRGRCLMLLSQLIEKEAWPKHGDFQDQLVAWETQVRDYEATTGKPFPEELRVATVLRNAAMPRWRSPLTCG